MKFFLLPAGNYAFYSKGILKISKFSEYKFEPKIEKPYKEIIKDLNKLLHESIKKHLVSDAPIGTFYLEV
jgi:asparagine synthase (glutamine-hydrolysing)